MSIPTWSFSRLKTFEQCKFRAHLMYELKIAEPERELKPGQLEHANDRGSRIHTHAEEYVRGAHTTLLPEMEKFTAEFEKLQRLYARGKVSLEGEWGMDHDWAPSDWSAPETWQRGKLDAAVFLSKYKAVVIDYKTGKRYGNEISHAEQTQLYQLNTFLRYPDLEEVTTELWYLDVNELISMTYTRAQGLRFKTRFHQRAEKLTTCTDFPPNPTIFTCRYCGYGPWGTGHCTKGRR